MPVGVVADAGLKGTRAEASRVPAALRAPAMVTALVAIAVLSSACQPGDQSPTPPPPTAAQPERTPDTPPTPPPAPTDAAPTPDTMDRRSRTPDAAPSSPSIVMTIEDAEATIRRGWIPDLQARIVRSAYVNMTDLDAELEPDDRGLLFAGGETIVGHWDDIEYGDPIIMVEVEYPAAESLARNHFRPSRMPPSTDPESSSFCILTANEGRHTTFFSARHGMKIGHHFRTVPETLWERVVNNPIWVDPETSPSRTSPTPTQGIQSRCRSRRFERPSRRPRPAIHEPRLSTSSRCCAFRFRLPSDTTPKDSFKPWKRSTDHWETSRKRTRWTKCPAPDSRGATGWRPAWDSYDTNLPVTGAWDVG